MKFLRSIGRSPVLAAALFLLGAAFLQPALATLYKWSQTAASNSNADATINWAEGMAPSAVNDSARAMMAAIAKYRDDNSGSLTTGGTSTAYTLTTNQVFASLATMSGQTVRVRMSATNGASPTLNVDSLGAKNIVSATGVAVATSALKSGAVYDFVYNNSTSEWTVINAPTIPTGMAIAAYLSACPTGWTKNSTAALNDAAARIVTGSGAATGGSTAFTTVFAARTIAQANLPNVSLDTQLNSGVVNVTDPGHSHTGGGLFDAASGEAVTDTTQDKAVITAVNNTGSESTDAATTGISAAINNLTGFTSTLSGGVAQTTIDFATKYADFIVCTKD